MSEVTLLTVDECNSQIDELLAAQQVLEDAISDYKKTLKATRDLGLVIGTNASKMWHYFPVNEVTYSASLKWDVN